MILGCFLMVNTGCSLFDSASSTSKETPTSVASENEKKASVGSQNEQTGEQIVRTYLKKEFTGPNEELSKILRIDDFAKQNLALKDYIDQNYRDLVAENQYQPFINANQILRWLPHAFRMGYQLQPKTIELEKISQNNAYTFKIELALTKEGKTNMTTVTGYINLNRQNKIVDIRDVDDKELVQLLSLRPLKQ
jgi:CRISPR/Cas system-associated exonuclease Cas4 (RecB family)